ncbi:hypothetical protein D1007_61180 [Hordeum vulgare]|nr:hypothetical protein D1007_61180 [Hordeum vulgare]
MEAKGRTKEKNQAWDEVQSVFNKEEVEEVDFLQHYLHLLSPSLIELLRFCETTRARNTYLTHEVVLLEKHITDLQKACDIGSKYAKVESEKNQLQLDLEVKTNDFDALKKTLEDKDKVLAEDKERSKAAEKKLLDVDRSEGRGEMADWGPVIVATVLFVLLTPGLLCTLPGRGRVAEFGSMHTSGLSILIHAVLYFALVTIFIIAVGVHVYTG